MNIEIGLITTILKEKDFLYVRDTKDIGKAFFSEYKQEFSFIEDYFLHHGEVPTDRVFIEKFSSFPLDEKAEEPLTYWCDEIRNKHKHNTLVSVLEKSVKLISEGDTDKAYGEVKKGFLHIENYIIENDMLNYSDVDNITKRKRLYEEKEKCGGITGIPYGIRLLDEILKGMQKKQLITLLAVTGVGKTFFLIIIACHCILNDYSVLFLTTEMGVEMIEDRFDAILFGLTCGNISYNQFKSGKLPPQKKEAYFNFLENVRTALEGKLVLDKATSPMGVSAKIDLHKPDVVFVDSAYLMQDDNNAESDWLRVSHITRDLHSIAGLKKLPIFINSQSDKNTSIKTGPELGNIGYSRAIGEDSDVVLALFRDEIMIEEKEMQIKVLKQREGVNGKVQMTWDFDNMSFEPIYTTVKMDDNVVEETEEDENDFIKL